MKNNDRIIISSAFVGVFISLLSYITISQISPAFAAPTQNPPNGGVIQVDPSAPQGSLIIGSAGSITTGIWSATPISISKGGTGATVVGGAGGALSNLGAAASGANNDITSLSALTGLTVSAPSPVIILKDSDSPAATQYGYISLQDNGNVERGWFGFGRGDLDLGIQNNNSAGITFHTAGTEKMKILSGGNVGIGASIPGAKLDVIDNSATANRLVSRIWNTNASGGSALRIATSAVSSGTLYPALELTDANYWIGSVVADRTSGLRFRTGTNISAGESSLSDRVTILPAGNVGIGTTTPGSKLTVVGDIKIGDTTNSRGLNIVQTYLSLGETESGASTILGNNVKVTDGVNNKVQVSASASDGSSFLKLNYNSGISIHRLGPAAVGTQYDDTAGELMRITNSGNVGIGTTTPSGVLDLGSATAGRALSWGGTAGNYTNIWSAYSSGSLVMASGLRGSTTADTYVSSYGGSSIGRSAIRLNLNNGDTQFFNNPATTVADGTAVTPTETIRILGSNGNVGIGTTSPQKKLDIKTSATSGVNFLQAVGGSTHLAGNAFGIAFDPEGYGNRNKMAIVSEGDSTGYSMGKLHILNRDSADSTEANLTNAVATFTKTGNVGIGNVGPNYKLDVVSGGSTTARFGTASTDSIIVGGGTGKITAGTFDPVYTIAGERYSTYSAGMIGVKEEVTGVVSLATTTKSASLDFVAAAKGSDLWLFRKASNLGEENFKDLVVLLSPSFEGKVWYKKDAKNLKVTIYGDRDGEVSYRLTAPRFDSAEWPNTSHEDVEGFNLDKLIK